MDRIEREQRIAELGKQIAEGEARIEARRRAREADPFAYDDHLGAERSVEPERDAYVQQNDAGAGLVFKRMDDALLGAPQPERSPSGDDEAWTALERFTTTTADALDEDGRRIAALERENAELRRRLDLKDERDRTVAERSARVSQLQAENTIAQREAGRAQLDLALADYRTRLDRLETQLGMLLRYLGGDLPRGWGRE
jgi:hypothetical protein